MSYLLLGYAIKKLHLPAVLAMSATVTHCTKTIISTLFNIDKRDIVCRDPINTNLVLSISQEKDKYEKDKFDNDSVELYIYVLLNFSFFFVFELL